MPELMGSDVADPSRLCGTIEFAAQSLLGEPPPVVGEEKLGGPSIARVRERTTLRSGGGDPVDSRLLVGSAPEDSPA